MRVKVNDREFFAMVRTRPNDSAWDGRESKSIHFAGVYDEAMKLFQNGVAWSVIITNLEDGTETETDMSVYALAGPVTDHRDGTVAVKMGKYKDTELMKLSLGEAPENYGEAMKVRSAIETAAQSLDDNTAAEVVSLFPTLKGDGGLIKAGTRIQWDGEVYKALVDLWDREDHNPENAPTLWEGI